MYSEATENLISRAAEVIAEGHHLVTMTRAALREKAEITAQIRENDRKLEVVWARTTSAARKA